MSNPFRVRHLGSKFSLAKDFSIATAYFEMIKFIINNLTYCGWSKLKENLMNCPSCKHPMIVLEFEEIETDYCTNCEGIWLDSELDCRISGIACCRKSVFKPRQHLRWKLVQCSRKTGRYIDYQPLQRMSLLHGCAYGRGWNAEGFASGYRSNSQWFTHRWQ